MKGVPACTGTDFSAPLNEAQFNQSLYQLYQSVSWFGLGNSGGSGNMTNFGWSTTHPPAIIPPLIVVHSWLDSISGFSRAFSTSFNSACFIIYSLNLTTLKRGKSVYICNIALGLSCVIRGHKITANKDRK